MLAPVVVDAPVLFPGVCCFCGRGAGRMIDTHKEDPDQGHLYVCMEVCVEAFARLAGWTEPAVTEAMVDTFRRQEAQIAGLEAEVAAAVEDRVVSLKDVRKLVGSGSRAPAGGAA